MIQIMMRAHAAVVAAVFGLSLIGGAALGAETLVERDGILIEDGYARATGAAAQTGAAYMVITNQGSAPDRLLAVESDAARRTGLHTTITTDGVARMRMLTGGIAIAPNETVVLEQGGAHVMLMGLTRPFASGGTVAATLVFEKAGRIPVALPVDLAGRAETPAHGAGH